MWGYSIWVAYVVVYHNGRTQRGESIIEIPIEHGEGCIQAGSVSEVSKVNEVSQVNQARQCNRTNTRFKYANEFVEQCGLGCGPLFNVSVARRSITI